MVLLHALGSSQRAWDPVLPRLTKHFEVFTVDLPGFGDSPCLPWPTTPTPHAIALQICEFLADVDIRNPHLVGNSLGGWIALEIARQQPVQSLTLLSPAGLWGDRPPRYAIASLRLSRWLSRKGGRPLDSVLATRVGRTLVLGQTHGRPWRLTTEQARRTISAMAAAPGFDSALSASDGIGFLGGAAITAPTTVAFGTRDFVLPRPASRRRTELPPAFISRQLPGCGHLPMFDAPDLVADLILHSALDDRRAVEPR